MICLLVVIIEVTAFSKRCKPVGDPCYEGTTSKNPKWRTFKDCCTPSEVYCNYDKPQDIYPGTCEFKTIGMSPDD